MNALADKVDIQEAAASRSAMYQTLSTAFFYPDSDRLRPCRVAEIPQRLRASLASLPYAVAGAEALIGELDAALGTIDEATLSALYTALFDNCKGRAAVSLYEKDYGNGEARVVWEEVIRFYEHFGLNFDVKESHDWPDHIGTELEFMHYLTFIEAAAPDGGESYRQPQGDFLSRHLAKWSPRFRIQLEAMEHHSPYGIVARLVEAFVDAEMDYLGRPRENSGNWVPMHEARSDIQDRTIIPIVDLSGSAYDELPY